MNISLKRQLLKTFVQMIEDLDNTTEIEKFLTDFLEPSDLEKQIKLLAIIYWLKKGRDKNNIKRNLGATEKEIVLAKELSKKEGVKLAIKKIEAEEWANQWADRIKKIVK